MSDVLRSAAERLKRFSEIAMQGTPSQAPAYRDAAYMEVYSGTPHTQNGDQLAVANSLLAEHPEDDGEPVTAGRLEAAGGVWVNASCIVLTKSADPVHLHVCDPGIPGEQRWVVGDQKNDRVVVRRPESMREFRRLCKALGIPLTEPTP